MKFRVRILRRAKRDQLVILNYIAERSAAGARAWVRAFEKVVTRLQDSADSFPLAPENELADCEVREVLFKTRRGRFYRVLFSIENEEVLVLHIRGPGQDFLVEDDF